MTGRSPSHLSPKCCVIEEPNKGGHGMFAIQSILRGEVICIWGGWVVDRETLASLPIKAREHAHQIAEGYYLTPLEFDEPASYINHSCNPNAGFSGQIVLVAMRDISPGEEVTFDYAMCDGSNYDEFVCLCRSHNCRGKVTGNDWQNPDLWRHYDGYFSPYLQNHIRHEQNGGEF